MIEARITGDTEVLARLGNAPGKITARIRKTMRELQMQTVQAAKDAYRSSGLHSRTANLINSIQPGRFSADESRVEAEVVAGGGEMFYARMQEYGGTVTPKNSRFLTIPLDAAKTPMGVGRWSARTIIADPSAGGYTGTFFKKGVLFGKRGHEVVPLFALKSSVAIPGRAFMRPALTRMRPIIYDRLSEAVRAAITE
ncbi:MAG TPA: hypothetical protein VMV27_07345 [Candidatus Binataceae bacterium]|nr:hypothetical protein [Candidatus Binataceae bacterium]